MQPSVAASASTFGSPPAWMIAATLLVFVAGCGSVAKRSPADADGDRQPPASAGKGGYYLDDGPHATPPANLGSVPDAVPRAESLRKANMRPYVALGKSYTPMTTLSPYKERGIASWYGRRFHGQKTASGEIYDMYAMTAAHTTLALPSYARVTNVRNGKSVVVRINDRGPFHSNRLIDLSYTAAYKLGVLGGGSAWVEVESIIPGGDAIAQNERIAPLAQREQEHASSVGKEEETRPSSVETATAAPAATVAPPDRAEIYVQLGAFGVRDNAQNFLARMRAELPALTESLGISLKGGLFRVHAGPYADQMLAQSAADRIAQDLAIKPVLLMR